MTRWTISLLAAIAAVTIAAAPADQASDLLVSVLGALVLALAAVWYWHLDVREQPEAFPKLRVAGLAMLVLLMAQLYALLVAALGLPVGLSRLLFTLFLATAAAAVVVALAAALDLTMLTRLRWARIVAIGFVAAVGISLTAVVAQADVAPAGTMLDWARPPFSTYPLAAAVALLALVAPMEWVVGLDRRQRIGVLMGWGTAIVPLAVAVGVDRLIPLPHQHLLLVATHAGALFCLVFVVVMLARATLALPGARAYERKVRELDAVYDFGLTAGAAFNPAELQAAALESVLKVVEPDVALLVEPAEDSAGCSCMLSRSDSGGRHVYRFQSRTRWGPIGERFADRSPVVVVDHRKAPPGVLQRVWEPASGSSVIVPVIGQNDRPEAVLIVGRFERHAFNTAEVRSLAGFATQVALAMDHAHLLRETVESERRQQELEIARDLQINLLPKSPPEIPGLDIADRSEPATEVGGDYFDYLDLGDDLLGIVVGDVAGHGMPAGLMMAMAKSAIHTQVQIGGSPSALLERLSETLLRLSADNQFMTMVFAELNTTTGDFRYSNAGHHYPLHLHAATGHFQELESTGIPLGMLPMPPGPFRTSRLEAGDILVFYSDGVVEATRADDEMFGLTRLSKVVLANRTRSAKTILEAVFREVRRFCGDEPLHDDATMVVVRAAGDAPSPGG